MYSRPSPSSFLATNFSVHVAVGISRVSASCQNGIAIDASTAWSASSNLSGRVVAREWLATGANTEWGALTLT